MKVRHNRDFFFIVNLIDINFVFSFLQFGQVGVADNADHCSPVQVKFPDDQAHSCYCSYPKFWLK